MDEQEMDVIERATPIDVDGPDADPQPRTSGASGQGFDWRARTDDIKARSAEFEQQVSAIPLRAVDGVVGVLPVQTREHLRQSAREGVLAVTSFVEAVGSAALMAVDRIYADPRTAQEKAQPRRIVIERDDSTTL